MGDQRCLLYAPRRGPCGPASPSSFCSSPTWGSCSSSAEWNGLLSSATGKTHKDHLSLLIVPHSWSSIHLNFPFTQIFCTSLEFPLRSVVRMVPTTTVLPLGKQNFFFTTGFSLSCKEHTTSITLFLKALSPPPFFPSFLLIGSQVS